MTPQEVRRIVDAATLVARRLGCGETVAVIDATTDVLALEHTDGGRRDVDDLAFAKAFTAITFDIDTACLADGDHPATALFQPPLPEATVYAGGMPLRRGGEVIGGVGVAGGDALQDRECALAAAAALERRPAAP